MSKYKFKLFGQIHFLNLTNIFVNLDKYAEQTNKQRADDASPHTDPVKYIKIHYKIWTKNCQFG